MKTGFSSLQTLARAAILAMSEQVHAGEESLNTSRQAGASPTAPGASTSTRESVAQIRSRVQLDAYLQAHANRPTPFDCLSPGARERFLFSLRWSTKELGGFGGGDLADELTDVQIHNLLMLFGADLASYAPPSRLSDEANHDAQQCQRSEARIDEFELRYNNFVRFADDTPRGPSDLQYAAAIPSASTRCFRRHAAPMRSSVWTHTICTCWHGPPRTP